MNWFQKQIAVVPVDFSDDAFAAIDVALDAVSSPAGIHVVHVLPVLTPDEPGMVWDAGADETRREHAEAALKTRLDLPRYAGLHLIVSFGDPGQEIAAYAAEVKAELIVLSSHGRTGLKRLLIGSVAERVCRLAHCPVLVLRT